MVRKCDLRHDLNTEPMGSQRHFKIPYIIYSVARY